MHTEKRSTKKEMLTIMSQMIFDMACDEVNINDSDLTTLLDASLRFLIDKEENDVAITALALVVATYAFEGTMDQKVKVDDLMDALVSDGLVRRYMDNDNNALYQVEE